MKIEAWRALSIVLAVTLGLIILVKVPWIELITLPANWNAISAIGTVVGSLLSAGTALIAARIAWYSYTASESAAKAAMAALNADRAWIVVSESKAEWHDHIWHGDDVLVPYIGAQIVAKNCGGSPALDVRIEQTLMLTSPDVLAPEVTHPDKTYVFPALPPGETQKQYFGISEDDAWAIIGGVKRMYNSVHTSYRDVFSEARRTLTAVVEVACEQDGPDSFHAYISRTVRQDVT